MWARGWNKRRFIKRKQERKKQELDQESDSEKKKVFSFFLCRVLVFFCFLVFLITFLVEFLISCFLDRLLGRFLVFLLSCFLLINSHLRSISERKERKGERILINTRERRHLPVTGLLSVELQYLALALKLSSYSTPAL